MSARQLDSAMLGAVILTLIAFRAAREISDPSTKTMLGQEIFKDTRIYCLASALQRN